MRLFALLAMLGLAASLSACGADGEPVPPGQEDNPRPDLG